MKSHKTIQLNRPKALFLAIKLGLVFGIIQSADAQVFPDELELSELDGSNGVVINGEAEGDSSGRSVSYVGDVNNDGIDDLIIGANFAVPYGFGNAGRSYVVFGSSVDLQSSLDLSELDGVNGFAIYGEDQPGFSGRSVSAAGDVNGDGVDDLIIGAYAASPNGITAAGQSYVVFGSATNLPNPLELSNLNGLNGFVINGEDDFDFSGFSVSKAGDFNNDGFDDLIIGAYSANSNGIKQTGRSYIVFGSDQSWPSVVELSELNGYNGIVINGEGFLDRSGLSVSDAGDFNGDGIDDVVIGAYGADPNSLIAAGRTYVLFGSSAGLSSPFDLSGLSEDNGIMIDGEAAYDFSGRSVSAVGDVNGDGIDDLIIGAAGPNNGRMTYIIFGSNLGLPNKISLSQLDGSNGFVINSEDEFGYTSRSASVSRAGDINGDGIDDLVIGDLNADPNGIEGAGRSYVVFGTNSGFSSPLELSGLNESNGFMINGEVDRDASGRSVSFAGDINNDGIDDLIIGADFADPNGIRDAGRSYVVFGRQKIELFADSFE